MPSTFRDVNDFLKQRTGSAQRTIAFYSNSPQFAPWEWMAPLAVFLQQKNYLVVLLSTYPMEGIPPALPYFIINAKEIVYIEGLSGVITMDTDLGPFPEQARVLAVGHGHVYDSSPTPSLEWFTLNSVRYDGFLVNIPLRTASNIKELWTGLFPSSAYQRPGTRFDILACGYLRTAAIQRHLQNEMEPDAICYAPVGSHHATGMQHGGNRIARYGRKILHTFLNNFPEYKIIFRPYPADYNNQDVKKIISEFKHYPSFLHDASSGKIDTFNRSAVLVTDISHIGNSFAFTTLRPAISFQPWKKGGGFQQAPHGGITYSFPSLVSTLRAFLDHRETMAKIIRRERDKGTRPPETAFEDFVILLEGFLAATPPTDCNNFISIPRVEPGCSVIEMIERLFPINPALLYSICTRSLHEDSALLLAIAILHMHANEPKTAIPKQIFNKLLSFSIPTGIIPATFGEAKNIGNHLLKMALATYIKKKDTYGTIFCENIINNCK